MTGKLTILVPQGAEYKSVCRGLKVARATRTPVFPIPISPKSVTQYLEKWLQADRLQPQNHPRVLLMGLCGSLTPQHSIGDIVLYKDCIYPLNVSTLSQMQSCDSELTEIISDRLQKKATLVKGLTCDRMIYSAAEKRLLAQKYQADVIDMEGFAALKVLHEAGIAVAVIRVVSDDCYHNIPNLTSALSSDGKLQSLPLALGMIRQPIAAVRLIRGSLRGLQVLREITTFVL